MKLGKNSLKTAHNLNVGNKKYNFYSLTLASKHFPGIEKLPRSLKILFENLLRFEDGVTVTKESLSQLEKWLEKRSSTYEIAFRPTRVLMQDFTGVPATLDLTSMRDAMKAFDKNPELISPLSPVDLVIDHSVMVDYYASSNAYEQNTNIEMQRNRERYEFLRWGQHAFNNFRVVPPGTGICHQVNLEYLAKTVWHQEINGEIYAFPDSVVGTDSHTTMINGLGVLGWGVGGIEAEAAMLGQPISMLIPEVIGFELVGKLKEGITATDLVLTITQMLRKKGVVGKFVEFYGEGLATLPLADRATIANMAPEYGATCGFFPIDAETIKYLQLTGRNQEDIDLVEAYAKAQGLWVDRDSEAPSFTDVVKFDLSDVVPSLAGPKRPQDKITLDNLSETFEQLLRESNKKADTSFKVAHKQYSLKHGDLVIAAITSCTNTSNPHVLMAAGLLAKKAVELGLTVKPWVKTSLAPGSKVVTDYLSSAGLLPYLDKLGFNLVGYGCTTCIGNSGPLDADITATIQSNDLIMSAILSGNRNFEGRIHPLVQANWLASPPLVIAFALLGHTRSDIFITPIGKNNKGEDIFLKNIWPSNHEIAKEVAKVSKEMFHKEYAEVFNGDATWQNIKINNSKTYNWKSDSTYIKRPPFFDNLTKDIKAVTAIQNARILAIFGDSITTDHISPAGSIKALSPAGLYLKENGVAEKDFNSYGARRGNHEVMVRGTFANIRIRNEMTPNAEGGITIHIPSGKTLPIYDAAMLYQKENTPLVIVAGAEYGTGSSRDWAAKGPYLLGVKAVIAQSFERIHRSNLIGMGILPLQFINHITRKTLNLTGKEKVFIDIDDSLKPQKQVKAVVEFENGHLQDFMVLCRIDTQNELEYYRNGGILQYMLRQF